MTNERWSAVSSLRVPRKDGRRGDFIPNFEHLSFPSVEGWHVVPGWFIPNSEFRIYASPACSRRLGTCFSQPNAMIWTPWQ